MAQLKPPSSGEMDCQKVSKNQYRYWRQKEGDNRAEKMMGVALPFDAHAADAGAVAAEPFGEGGDDDIRAEALGKVRVEKVLSTMRHKRHNLGDASSRRSREQGWTQTRRRQRGSCHQRGPDVLDVRVDEPDCDARVGRMSLNCV